MRNRVRIAVILALLVAFVSRATIFGTVRGIVHDPQHRPLQGAMVMLQSKSSEWAKNTTTDSNGEFRSFTKEREDD